MDALQLVISKAAALFNRLTRPAVSEASDTKLNLTCTCPGVFVCNILLKVVIM